MKHKNLLKLLDLEKDDIIYTLNLADQLKYEQKHGIKHKYLSGKVLGIAFDGVSVLDRTSFEVGMFQLGGSSVNLPLDSIRTEKEGTIENTIRAFSKYLDALVVKSFEQDKLELIAKNISMPIINSSTDISRPCQVLADLMAIRQLKDRLEGLKICFIGECNSLMNSYIVGALKAGMTIHLVCPNENRPADCVLEFANKNDNFKIFKKSKSAAKNADVIVAGGGSSLIGKDEDKKQELKDYQVNDSVLSVANELAVVLHCNPDKKDEEITDEVFKSHLHEIFLAVENRLHVQKAILVRLMLNRY